MDWRRGIRSLAALGLALTLLAGSHAIQSPPDDPLLEEQWALSQIHAPGAWSRSTGTGATIAIIDTGVDVDHEDLVAQDPDGSEEVPPRIVDGATFLDCGDEPCGDGGHTSGPPEYGASSHGTHVAGVAAAVADNGIGVAGVAPDARIMPIRVGGSNGGLAPADTARAIRWAVAHDADVINLSLGAIAGFEIVSPLVDQIVTPLGHYDALEEAVNAGVVVVAAAGNHGWPMCADPAFVDGLVCVTSVNRRGQPVSDSNRGVKPDQQVVAAPGGEGAGPFLLGPVDDTQPGLPVVSDLSSTCRESVLSTLPPRDRDIAEECDLPSSGAYGYMGGTSVASPHVAGVAALLRSMGCGAPETIELLLTTARNPVTGQRGTYSPHYGYGIIDGDQSTAAAAEVC